MKKESLSDLQKREVKEMIPVVGRFERAEHSLALTFAGFTGTFGDIEFEGTPDIGGRGLVLYLKRGKLKERWTISMIPMIKEFLRLWEKEKVK